MLKLPAVGLLAKIPPLVRIAVVAVLAVAIIGSIMAAMLFRGDGETDPATAAGSAFLPALDNQQLSVEIGQLHQYIEENRTGINQIINDYNASEQCIAVLAEQTAAILQSQQALSRGNIGQRISQIDEAVRELSEQTEQTRREAEEVTAIRTSLAILQRQKATDDQAIAARLEGISNQTQDLQDAIAELGQAVGNLSGQVAANRELLDNPNTFAPEKAEASLAKQAAECLARRLQRPPDARFSHEKIASEFAATYLQQLEDGTLTSDELSQRLADCRRDLW